MKLNFCDPDIPSVSLNNLDFVDFWCCQRNFIDANVLVYGSVFAMNPYRLGKFPGSLGNLNDYEEISLICVDITIVFFNDFSVFENGKLPEMPP